MIDLRRLHVLRAVAHYGTVTAAASALHFTTSAASQQIRQLARDLGVDLLEPQGRGVRLTSAAESLLAHADAIQARWEEIPGFRVAYDELNEGAENEATAGPAIGDYRGIRRIVAEAESRMYLEDLSPEDAISQAATEANEALTSYNSRL